MIMGIIYPHCVMPISSQKHASAKTIELP
jgi:hypothetical protein